MLKLFKTIWRDPVWSKVIAFGIIAVIGVSWAWLKNIDHGKGNSNGKYPIQGNEKITIFPSQESKPPSPQPPKIDQKEKETNEFDLLVNRNITVREGKSNIALVIESKRTESGFTPENALYNLLMTEKINLILNLFKEETFKAKGFFRDIYDGDIDILKQANALVNIDYLILGKLNYSFQRNERVDRDLISCNINFSYKTISKNSEIIKSDSINVVGPGFTKDSALRRGLEILSDQYSTKILTPIL